MTKKIICILITLIFTSSAIAHSTYEEARRLYDMSTLDPSLLPLAINELKKVIALTDDNDERTKAAELLRKIQSNGGYDELPDPIESGDNGQDDDNSKPKDPRTLNEYSNHLLIEYGIDLSKLKGLRIVHKKIVEIAKSVPEEKIDSLVSLLFPYTDLLLKTSKEESGTLRKIKLIKLAQYMLLLSIELNPAAENYKAHQKLGVLYSRTGRPELAIQHLDIAFNNTLLEDEPVSANAETNLELGMLLMKSEDDELITQGRVILLNFTRLNPSQFTMGETELAQDMQDRAKEFLENRDFI